MASVYHYASERVRNSNSAIKNITGLGAAGAAFDGITTFMDRRSEHPDESTLKSGAIAAGTAAAWLFAEPLMWGITVGQLGAAGVKMGIDEAHENRAIKDRFNQQNRHINLGNGERLNQATLGGNFQDSEQAATLRQRQLQSLRQSRIQTENILGSEARQLHR